MLIVQKNEVEDILMKDEKMERELRKLANNYDDLHMSFETKEIREVIISICYGMYVLPEIQREFVWEKNKEIQFVIDMLFNYNNVQICGGDRITLLKPRGKEYYYVIDGQQRISSLVDFLYLAKFDISDIVQKNMRELVEICKSKTKRDKILNLYPNQLGLTLKTNNIKFKNEKIKKYVNEKKVTNFDEEFILDFMKKTLRIEIITVPNDEELIKRIQKMFLDINNRVNITEGEKIKAEYFYQNYYRNRYDLAIKFSKYIKVKDKNFTQLISALIDIDKAREGKYGASYAQRKKFIESKNEDFDYIKKTEKLNFKIIDILLNLFQDKPLLSEYNHRTSLWNKHTNIATIVPWFLAIEELLQKEINEIIFGEKKEKILNEWKNITNRTNWENNTLGQKWIEGKTDHSANKNKIVIRKEIIIDLLKMSIN